ncbi:2939_t:CDS:2 [Funneliformis geosporum]|uniref:13423_t:CDS:1 n=1 Tax=Funneliformis geosporum TaxID=1117311 RepID=A0A9W4SCM7_9GLOM|nr:13423_t:CDS:2 [Funneliformis geosporum]CAI2180109.1 2939_t:CDS:2 [Funneliformis geosporum]
MSGITISTNSLVNNTLMVPNKKSHNKTAKSRNNSLTLSNTIKNINLPTPSPTPTSPCFVHSTFDPTLSSPLQEIMDSCENQPADYSKLAETAVGVREISKKLGQARIKCEVKTIMIVTKPGDLRLINLTRELALYLITTPRFGKGHGVTVYVDKNLKNSERFDFSGMLKSSPLVKDYLKFWTHKLCADRAEIFNFVLTLGGDGTVLYTSWLFQKTVPPVLPFHLGSLGFLTNFNFKDHKTHLTNVLEKGFGVNMRMRFSCTVYRRVRDSECVSKARRCGETGEIIIQNPKDGEGLISIREDDKHKSDHDKYLTCVTTQPAESFEVLNDLVVDRGAGPYMSLLELFGDEQHLTTVQADGLVVSTPTGSTAYSVSAGGSLVHPEIPALLLTPICPHTLSFRPMLLPDSMELRICVPYNSRSTAWASFDGRNRIELRQGDHIKVTPSKFPFPTVCLESQSRDWFNSISRCLRWNERERQKTFVVVEEDVSDEDVDDGCSESTENDSETTNVVEADLESSRIQHREPSLIIEKQIHQHNNIQQQNNNSNKQHRRGNSVHAFACVGKDNSDTSSNTSSGGEGGGQEEWKVVRRGKKKKKA